MGFEFVSSHVRPEQRSALGFLETFWTSSLRRCKTEGEQDIADDSYDSAGDIFFLETAAAGTEDKVGFSCRNVSSWWEMTLGLGSIAYSRKVLLEVADTRHRPERTEKDRDMVEVEEHLLANPILPSLAV